MGGGIKSDQPAGRELSRLQRGEHRRLDLVEHSEPAVDEPGIKLHEIGAGPDFCHCRGARIDAADPINESSPSARTNVSASMRLDRANSGRPKGHRVLGP